MHRVAHLVLHHALQAVLAAAVQAVEHQRLLLGVLHLPVTPRTRTHEDRLGEAAEGVHAHLAEVLAVGEAHHRARRVALHVHARERGERLHVRDGDVRRRVALRGERRRVGGHGRGRVVDAQRALHRVRGVLLQSRDEHARVTRVLHATLSERGLDGGRVHGAHHVARRRQVQVHHGGGVMCCDRLDGDGRVYASPTHLSATAGGEHVRLRPRAQTHRGHGVHLHLQLVLLRQVVEGDHVAV